MTPALGTPLPPTELDYDDVDGIDDEPSGRVPTAEELSLLLSDPHYRPESISAILGIDPNVTLAAHRSFPGEHAGGGLNKRYHSRIWQAWVLSQKILCHVSDTAIDRKLDARRQAGTKLGSSLRKIGDGYSCPAYRHTALARDAGFDPHTAKDVTRAMLLAIRAVPLVQSMPRTTELVAHYQKQVTAIGFNPDLERQQKSLTNCENELYRQKQAVEEISAAKRRFPDLYSLVFPVDPLSEVEDLIDA